MRAAIVVSFCLAVANCEVAFFLSVGGLGSAIIGVVDTVEHLFRCLYVARLFFDPSMHRCLSRQTAAITLAIQIYNLDYDVLKN